MSKKVTFDVPKPKEGATGEPTKEQRIREVALQHASGIEDKKKLQNRVLDLILEAFDLPADVGSDPARPSKGDAALFHECLRLFCPTDLDELVQERNIDARCGYALCPRNKQGHGDKDAKVWNGKSGKDFALVNKSDLNKWCSKQCEARTMFVRSQLSTEPAWLRSEQNNDVQLLDELSVNLYPSSTDATGNVVNPAKIALSSSSEGNLQALSLERGNTLDRNAVDKSIVILEHESTKVPESPKLAANEVLEGLPIRTYTKKR